MTLSILIIFFKSNLKLTYNFGLKKTGLNIITNIYLSNYISGVKESFIVFVIIINTLNCKIYLSDKKCFLD